MEAICSSESSVDTQQTTRRYIPKVGTLHVFLSFSENYFFSDPELNEPIPMDFLSHKERYEETVRKACIVYKKLQEVRKATGEINKTRYNIQYIEL
jgi:hypothetical protein